MSSSSAPIPQGISFRLTPIEQNGPRQYKRVAIVLKFVAPLDIPSGETTVIHERIFRLFYATMAMWPFLRNSLGITGEGKLTMLTTLSMYKQDTYLPDPADRARLYLQLLSSSPSAAFFRSEEDLQYASGTAPVMLKLTWLHRSILVLGFCFHEAIVDNEFISRFFWSMLNCEFAITRYTQRWPLDAVEPAQINRDLFPFYDWSESPLPQCTPKDRLLCRTIEFKAYDVKQFIANLRDLISRPSSRVGATDKDYALAMLWYAIARARYQYHKLFGYEDMLKLNILLPGESHALRDDIYDQAYFGSSMTPTVAKIQSGRMIRWERGGGSFRNTLIRSISATANEIRRAINRVDRDYVQQFMGLKASLQPSVDREAYERGINRHTTGLVFEDCSKFYLDNWTPQLTVPWSICRPGVMLCAEDKEEGKIVLLPVFIPRDVEGNVIGWRFRVCLDVALWPWVLYELAGQGWITERESRFVGVRVNTAASS